MLSTNRYLPFLIIPFILVGCATSRSVVEKSAFEGDFSKYKNVAIVLEPNPKVESKYDPETILRTLKKMLVKKKAFPTITTIEDMATELVVKIRVGDLDAPGAVSTLLFQSFANSEVKVHCSFIEKKMQRTVATMEAMGNSKNMPRASAGGIGLTDAESYTERAYENAAEAIVNYIEDHHSGIKNSKKKS